MENSIQTYLASHSDIEAETGCGPPYASIHAAKVFHSNEGLLCTSFRQLIQIIPYVINHDTIVLDHF